MSMQGTVLGFSTDSGDGVINGADGGRYKFTASAWKGEDAPRAGIGVDFEVSPNGEALDIYPLKATTAARSAPKSERGISIGASSPDAGRYLDFAKKRPAIIAAAIALVASLFVSFITVTPPRDSDVRLPDSATVFGVSGLVQIADRTLRERTAAYTAEIAHQNELIENYQQMHASEQDNIRREVDRYRRQREQYARYGYLYGAYTQTAEAYQAELERQSREGLEIRVAPHRESVQQTQTKLDRLNQEKMFPKLSYLAYLTPLLAALILFLEFTGRSSRLAGLAFGVSAVASVGLIYFARSRLESLFADLGGVNAALAGSDLLSPALGAWLLLLAAAAAVALGFGLVKFKGV